MPSTLYFLALYFLATSPYKVKIEARKKIIIIAIKEKHKTNTDLRTTITKIRRSKNQTRKRMLNEAMDRIGEAFTGKVSFLDMNLIPRLKSSSRISLVVVFNSRSTALSRLPCRSWDANHRDRRLARGEIYGRSPIGMAVVIGILGIELIAAIVGVLLDLGEMGYEIWFGEIDTVCRFSQKCKEK